MRPLRVSFTRPVQEVFCFMKDDEQVIIAFFYPCCYRDFYVVVIIVMLVMFPSVGDLRGGV